MDVDKSATVILNQIRVLVSENGDGTFGSKTKALEDIDALLTSPSAHGVNFLLAPTANLQEVAIDNGWGTEFNNLAQELEKVLGLS
jgi:tRNA U34 5-methylaminomethyl-2-thiouridine-forming methyltransferase MnmC